MAMMIPSVISPEVKSSAERRVFEWFQSAPGTDDWIVLHSLGITTHSKVIYGETDFLVLAPQLGIFALEVKGGRVKRENGIWYFTNRYGKTNSKARGPFEQAKDGIFSIVDSIKKRLDGTHRHIGDILFGYGVMFPDIEYVSMGIDEEQWQVFDAKDGTNVTAFIRRLSRGSKEKWESVYGHMNQSKLPQASDIKRIASILRGDFDCAVVLNSQFRNSSEDLMALTKEQYRCLDQLDDNPRCLIQGAAGTGKTLLAMEEVKKAAAQGKRVALFCFNSTLADWLADYFNNMPEAIRPSYVGTFHKYMSQIVRKNIGKLANTHSSDYLRNYFENTLPEVAISILERASEQFDKIVVDEAQDLIRDNYLAVMSCCLKKGLSRGQWTMFGDFSMQAIYADGITGSAMIDKLSDISAFIRFKLTVNCRNTKPICKEIEIVTGFKSPSNFRPTVDGPPVHYITWLTMEDQYERLKEILMQLEKGQIEPNKITILSPRRREDSVVSLLTGYKIKDYCVPQGMSITFSTIQAFKGLENTVIILTDIDSFSSDKLMYVGLSRARAGLFVLESAAAKREYDDLLIRRLIK